MFVDRTFWAAGWECQMRTVRDNLKEIKMVPPRGFDPLISTLKGWRP